MFAALLKSAQASVDSAIGQAVNRMVIAVPFVVATAFATAALYLRLERAYGAETASLILAGMFAAAGLLTVLLSGRSAAPRVEALVEDARSETAGTDAPNAAAAPISSVDKELLLAALTTAAPIALPSIVRGVLRNLPLVAVIVAVILMFLSNSTQEGEATPADPNS